MSEPTSDGVVFRTDANLRPEGRSGALSRTLDSYAAWYERWARPWEFQALIKARAAAGDVDLGEQFVARTRPVVWADVLDPDALREARAMKARSEADLPRRGLTERELKRGPAAIPPLESPTHPPPLVHPPPPPH